jgi:uncharacterized protein YceK
MKWSSVAIVLTLLTLSVGCSSSRTLTRGKVKDLIEESPARKVFEVATDEEVAAGVKEGLWTQFQYHPGYLYSYKPTNTDHPCVTFVDDHPRLEGTFKRKVVEVTGISDVPTAGEGLKEADFTYVWDTAGCSNVVSKVFAQPKKASVGVKLYDDGWRLAK